MHGALNEERAEPRRTRRGEARDALLRAPAAGLFLERGYDSGTVDHIVREVGGSKGSVYSFFGGKEGPFFAPPDENPRAPRQPLHRPQLKCPVPHTLPP